MQRLRPARLDLSFASRRHRIGSSIASMALAASLAMLGGCSDGPTPTELLDDSPLPPEMAAIEQAALDVPSDTACIFHAVAGSGASAPIAKQLDITVDPGASFIISRDGVTGVLIINNLRNACRMDADGDGDADDPTVGVEIRTSDIRKLVLAGADPSASSGGIETALLNFRNGRIAVALTTAPGSGIEVRDDLEKLDIALGSAVDRIGLGAVNATGPLLIDLDGLKPADLTIPQAANAPAMAFSLGSGNDVFEATGATQALGVPAGAWPRPVTVYGGSGNDIITGGENNDVLNGGIGNDTLVGGEGEDQLRGGAGNDLLRGGPGQDWVEGEEGSDTIDEGSEDSGADMLFGWIRIYDDGTTVRYPTTSSNGTPFEEEPTADIDTLTYASRTDPVFVSPGARRSITGTWTVHVDEMTAERITGGDDGGNGERDVVRGDFEVIIGGRGADVFYSGPRGEKFDGGPGDDTFYCMATGDSDGGDTFIGGPGTDLVSYVYRLDSVCVSIGDTQPDGTCEWDPDIEPTYCDWRASREVELPRFCDMKYTLAAGSIRLAVVDEDPDTTGNQGDDVRSDVENLEGGQSDDILVGGSGPNVLRGNVGDDRLFGQGGDDTFDEWAGNEADETPRDGAEESGADEIYGGDGIDTVDYGQRTNSICATIAPSTGLTCTTDDDCVNGDQSCVIVSSLGIRKNWCRPEPDDGAGCTVNALPLTPLAGGEGDNLMSDVENLIGGSAADYLGGNAADNTLAGGEGNDYADCGTGDGDIVDDADDAYYLNNRCSAFSCEHIDYDYSSDSRCQ